MDRDEVEPIKKPEKMHVDSKFIVKVGDKEFVRLDGLLDLAHRRGITALLSEMVTLDLEKKVAVFKAQCVIYDEEGKDTNTFTAFGDACPENVSAMTKASWIRMAESRATARVLRKALNVNACSFEELDGEVREEKVETPLGDLLICRECKVNIEDVVARYSLDKFKKYLCRNCQAKARGQTIMG